MATVAVKKVNEKLYRKVKALASLRGRTIGETVNEALSLWVQLTSKNAFIEDWLLLEDEARRNNEIYEKNEADLISKHRGKYVVVAQGTILGTFTKSKDAYAAARKAGVKHAIVTRLENKPMRVMELGWSVMEQLT
ncbi:MAG: hypothetical protein HYU39_00650 [Thaumarchaeota archaeon]|nr:hypothetical protein [Nitrososphaerota archaeon]